MSSERPKVEKTSNSSAVSLSDLSEWKELLKHRERLDHVSLRELFAADEGRAEQFSLQQGNWWLDYSKNRMDRQVLDALLAVADAVGLQGHIEALFSGQRINRTENRAVAHMALRSPAEKGFEVDGEDVSAAVHHVLSRMESFSERLRSGEWKGYTGRRIRHVVNIGIGGSDLGPRMASAALASYADPSLKVTFVANVDGEDLRSALRSLDPEETLFIICSKTFTTSETMTNAESARNWLLASLKDEAAVSSHFVAVSTNRTKVVEFGIDASQMFEFWEWVGGRYSLCSAVGLSLMVGIGPARFFEMLAGFHSMDEHFRLAPFSQNMPVLLGLIGVWHASVLGYETHCVVPYAEALRDFPSYLQQLDMESNGKRVDEQGQTLKVQSGPIVFGQTGTNGQHAFFQLLHQGTHQVPCDFIGFSRSSREADLHHDILMANFLAQTKALAFGRSAQEVESAGVSSGLVPHRTFPGNRPTNTLLAPSLTPYSLGELIALYEHKVFVQGSLFGIDSFDQWGVELGKSLAQDILPAIVEKDSLRSPQDSSTQSLLDRYLRQR
ncbi:MAG: glucose-6-phosphate isomerase [Deltaproteobacteria bacterium]|nr:glucose-6-phosphate isomerase [Deltaproteobacteria bacterium]